MKLLLSLNGSQVIQKTLLCCSIAHFEAIYTGGDVVDERGKECDFEDLVEGNETQARQLYASQYGL